MAVTTRDRTFNQLLVALDFMKPSTVREGFKWLPEKKMDAFFVTLNKSDKDYSPTTMYIYFGCLDCVKFYYTPSVPLYFITRDEQKQKKK